MLITGGTGYLGRALVPALLARGHRVRLLVRPGSERTVPAGAEAVAGNPLDAASVAAALGGVDTLVHLVGVPKPSPAKARQFREIDLVSIQASVAALVVQRWQRQPWRAAAIGAWVAGAVLPTAGFTVYFSTQVPWRVALGFACRAWLSVATTSRFVGDPVQTGFLGFDQPGPHLLTHAGATLLARLLLVVIGGGAWLADRTTHPARRFLTMGVIAVGLVTLAWCKISWADAGR